MDEDFDSAWSVRWVMLGDFRETEFAGDHDALHAEVADELDAAGSVSVICVEPWMGSAGQSVWRSRAMPRSWTMTASTPASAMAARYSTAAGSSSEKIRVLKVRIAADVVGVQVIHDVGEFGEREVGGPVAGVELVEAEIDGIGAVGHGGAEGVPISGGGEEFEARGGHFCDFRGRQRHEYSGCGGERRIKWLHIGSYIWERRGWLDGTVGKLKPTGVAKEIRRKFQSWDWTKGGSSGILLRVYGNGPAGPA